MDESHNQSPATRSSQSNNTYMGGLDSRQRARQDSQFSETACGRVTGINASRQNLLRSFLCVSQPTRDNDLSAARSRDFKTQRHSVTARFVHSIFLSTVFLSTPVFLSIRHRHNHDSFTALLITKHFRSGNKCRVPFAGNRPFGCFAQKAPDTYFPPDPDVNKSSSARQIVGRTAEANWLNDFSPNDFSPPVTLQPASTTQSPDMHEPDLHAV